MRVVLQSDALARETLLFAQASALCFLLSAVPANNCCLLCLAPQLCVLLLLLLYRLVSSSKRALPDRPNDQRADRDLNGSQSDRRAARRTKQSLLLTKCLAMRTTGQSVRPQCCADDQEADDEAPLDVAVLSFGKFGPTEPTAKVDLVSLSLLNLPAVCSTLSRSSRAANRLQLRRAE